MKSMLVATVCSAMIAGTVVAGEWHENVKVKGDFRYRHEMIDKEGKDARNRHRLRARVGIEGKVSEYTTVMVQMATGSDDPVSTNQTLDDAFSSKDFRLDLAYLKTKHHSLPGVTIIGGKFKNPFFKPGESELIWDSDWNPEGGVLKYDRSFDEISMTLIGSGLWIDERSSGDDSWLGAVQAVLRYDISDNGTSLALGGGYFQYVNAKICSPFFDASEPAGNTYDSVMVDDEYEYVYYNDYELVELFAEATHVVDGIPITVMGDFVTNTAADFLDTGWLVGVRLGKTKKQGSWAFRYNYREVEKDAVVGAYTDSDFRGGGTDAKGHEFGGGYQLAGNTTFNVSYFISTIGLDAAETDFNRLQVDLQLKF